MSRNSNIIAGSKSDDWLSGSGIFNGGKGNDNIFVTEVSGSTLRFNLGDGQDNIYSYWYQKGGTIQFGADVTTDMIDFQRKQDDLLITVGNRGDQIALKDFFSVSGDIFTRFEFADGSVWQDFRQTTAWANSDLANVIRGTDSSDCLSGSGVFDAGKGDDAIYISNASESTLRFNLGDGQDRIQLDNTGQQSGAGTIQFGTDVTSDMISFQRSQNDLFIIVGNGGDRIALDDFFTTGNDAFTRVEFADGSVWQDFRQSSAWANSDLTNVIRGSNRDDVLTGSGLFDAGKGNDLISVDNVSESTLRFNLGDGQDIVDANWYRQQEGGTIQFGADISPDSIVLKRSGYDLIVAVNGSSDQITFREYFITNSNRAFNRFEFADGSVWQDIRKSAAWDDQKLGCYTLLGTDGRDYLTGSGVVIGGKGNDSITINGREDNILYFNQGDGRDVVSIMYAGENNKIVFGAGITSDMISFGRDYNNLVINVGDNGDQILLATFFTSKKDQAFSTIEFADGTVWQNIRDTSAWKNADLQWVIADRYQNEDSLLQGSGTFISGAGNDIIKVVGDVADSIIQFNLGDGRDSVDSGLAYIDSSDAPATKGEIRFGAGITADMLSLSRSNDNLVIKVGNGGDSLSLSNFFTNTRQQGFTRFTFSDGSTLEDIRQTALWKNSDFNTIRGTDGNDFLSGGGATFEGGKGNDSYLITNPENSVIRFNIGDGNDSITVWGSPYNSDNGTIRFGEGITADMVSVSRNNRDLVIQVGDVSAGDSLTVKDFYQYAIDQGFTRIEFSDNSVWDNVLDHMGSSSRASVYSSYLQPLAGQVDNLLSAMAGFSASADSGSLQPVDFGTNTNTPSLVATAA